MSNNQALNNEVRFCIFYKLFARQTSLNVIRRINEILSQNGAQLFKFTRQHRLLELIYSDT